MAHLQTEPPFHISSNRPGLRKKIPTKAQDNDVAKIIVRAFSRHDAVARYDVPGVVNEVTHIIEIDDKQSFPAQHSSGIIHILVTGWGFRSQLLQNGARQITDVIAPGDFCGIADLERERSSYVEACGPARVAVLDTDSMSESSCCLVEHVRRTQQDEVLSRLRARLVSIGRRDARERLSYLVAETHARLSTLDLTEHNIFNWPFTQEQLGDILGLTPVHINRVLARLRDEGLFLVRNRQMVILDLPGLRRIGEWEPPTAARGLSSTGIPLARRSSRLMRRSTHGGI